MDKEILSTVLSYLLEISAENLAALVLNSVPPQLLNDRASRRE